METQTQIISFPSDERQFGGSTPGYLARPTGRGPYPGVVVLQEWWGLVPHIKEVAERFAAAGFVVLAPDLYYGEAAAEPDEARKLAMELDRERAVGEVLAAGHYLRGMDLVAPKRLGVVGWCMGGSITYHTAASGASEFGAAVAFYGSPRELDMIANINIPLLGLYGELDRGIPVERVREIERLLKENDVPHKIHLYEGAHHAFFNDTRPQAYHAEAAADAWDKTLAWLRQHLIELMWK